jgi:hypothetical protein
MKKGMGKQKPLLKVECLSDLVDEFKIFTNSVDVHMKVINLIFKFKFASFTLSTLNHLIYVRWIFLNY